MREIITLQFGTFSNFVGSHFWNMQHEQLQQYIDNEQRFGEVNHDVLFRSRETRDGQLIHTPRLVLFDMRGSLERPAAHHTHRRKELTDEQYKALGQASWGSGNVEVRRTERATREPHMYQKYLGGTVDVISEEERAAIDHHHHHASTAGTEATSASEESPSELLPQREKVTRQEILQSLDENTRTWSDFQRAEYHERSMHELMHYEKDIHDFDVYSVGSQVLDRQDEMDQVTESIRYFLEDCDSLRAFQVLTDTGDSWGAFTVNTIDRVIHDELSSKTPILLFGCSPFHFLDDFATPADHDKMVLNSALAFADLYRESTTMIPLSAQMLSKSCFPHMHIDPHNRYHSAAVLAAAIDTATIPLRLARDYIEIGDFCNNLAVLPSMKVSTLCTAMPFPLHQGKSFYETLAPMSQIHQSDVYVPLSPMVKRTEDIPLPYAQSAIIRGISDVPLYPHTEAQPQHQTSVEMMLKKLLNQSNLRQEISNRHVVENRALADHADHNEMWESYVEQVRTFKATSNVVSQGLTIPDSFPMRTLSNRLTEEGFIAAEGVSDRSHDILRMPHATHVQTTRQISDYVQHLHDNMEQHTKQIPLQYNTITRELLSEYKEAMLQLIDNYEE